VSTKLRTSGIAFFFFYFNRLFFVRFKALFLADIRSYDLCIRSVLFLFISAAQWCQIAICRFIVSCNIWESIIEHRLIWRQSRSKPISCSNPMTEWRKVFEFNFGEVFVCSVWLWHVLKAG
jgi:hypothetical protein